MQGGLIPNSETFPTNKQGLHQIPRTDKDQIASLEQQLLILRDGVQSFSEGKTYHLKAIASGLRVLIVSSKTNRPLLLRLMKRFNFSYKFYGSDRKHFKPIRVSLQWYLDTKSTSITLPVHGQPRLVGFSANNIIQSYANQYGLSHEDPSISESLIRLDSITIFGQSLITNTILHAADRVMLVGVRFLEHLEKNNISEASQNINPMDWNFLDDFEKQMEDHFNSYT